MSKPWKCFFGFHVWHEESRWGGAWWDTVHYICLECGDKYERWEHYDSNVLSLDPKVKEKQKKERAEELEKARERAKNDR